MIRSVSTQSPSRPAARAGALLSGLAMVLALGACNALDRLSQVGNVPPLAKIESPSVLHGNKPVEMPMPPPVEIRQQPNSLWRAGSRHFLKDQRASEVGDILTVNISIEDSAEIENTTTRSRDNSEDAGLNAFLGYETEIARFLPEGFDPLDMIDFESSGSSTGAGTVNRDEDIDLRIAALVTQVLPNGNLVIAGRQEVRVNFEVRELQVAGLIRPEDITSTNTIEFDQIAEARIAYGGRGHISDIQQPRYGHQVYDILWPF